jgi:hypothetical protein
MQKTEMSYSLRGQASGAITNIIALIVGMGVATLLLIFVGALGGQTYNLVEPDINAVGNSTATSEVISAVNGSTVAGRFLHGDIHTGTLKIFNTTHTLGIGNFSVNYQAGTFVYAPSNSIAANATSYSANYSYGDLDMRTTVKAGIKNSFSALDQTGGYLPIVALAIIIFIVLGLVLGFGAIGTGGGRTAL